MPLAPSAVGSAPNLRTYGLPLVNGMTQFDYERAAVAFGQNESKGGYREFVHLKNVADVLGPKLEWNPWLEQQFESLNESRWVVWAGCAGAGKTDALCAALVVVRPDQLLGDPDFDDWQGATTAGVGGAGGVAAGVELEGFGELH